ncbi:putative bifunctional diguanylate cyclase/phosphodiesterase [Demequina zhanjiangensis]|uniref:EAL domain-containing protein n=1 Tax=Demequina zhanjiangensis TaxID=3051659 RepID=A0ABT8G062_9MICO|nr:EAL domain-containing protein [Demequina sp. SYSU T00b26]MDN4472487.1 EAL domain-containing protein [Demequina sp. SYSU T00b26]
MSRTENLFRQAFQESPIGMAILDDAGRYEEVNAAFASTLGLSLKDVLGRSFTDFTHPDDLAQSHEALARIRSGAAPSAKLLKRYRSASGDTIWARITVSDAPGSHADPRHRLVVQVEDVTEERRAKDLLTQRTHYDHLTGLANRTLLLDRLALSIDSHRDRISTVACLFLDVDHFKVVNDSLGHEAGDIMLVEIARRIQDSVRPGDTVARLGGDEFVVVLENIRSRAVAEGVITAITEAVQSPILLETHELVPTVSIGLAMADEDSSAEGLVRAADTAMSAAKEEGRARVAAYHPRMRRDAMSKLSVEAELRTAIRDDQLDVYYQPIVDLPTRRIIAFEALVRWHHPSRGLLQPDEFIGVAEDSNLIVPLGAHVIHQACAFIAEHPEFNGRVLVNVSTKQIGAADLTRVVRSALSESGIDPSRLGLEITETGMLMASHAAKSDLEALTALGIDLVVDDFGTGYSALSSILLNPVSGLKLAREFTLRLGDRSTGDRISLAMATLTLSLDMYGVIEGIETEAQYSVARRHGWTYGQGYLFGHPTPAHEIIFSPDGSAQVPSGERSAALAAGHPPTMRPETPTPRPLTDPTPTPPRERAVEPRNDAGLGPVPRTDAGAASGPGSARHGAGGAFMSIEHDRDPFAWMHRNGIDPSGFDLHR